MEIVIEHARYAPKWETVQQLLRETTNNTKATITKIDREDKGTDYRKTGVYNIMLDQGNNTALPITLEVVPVGQKPNNDEIANKSYKAICKEEFFGWHDDDWDFGKHISSTEDAPTKEQILDNIKKIFQF